MSRAADGWGARGRRSLRGGLQVAAGVAAVAVVATLLLAPVDGGRAAGQTPDPYQVRVVQTTADLAQRLTPLPDAEFQAGAPPAGEPVIAVAPGIGYQQVRGFGAAMTDTSAWLIERKLSPAARAVLWGELFGASGIRLSSVRMPIGASDFTAAGRPYTYDDLPPRRSDPSLRRFSIARDRPYVIPALRQVHAVNPAAQFLATPWSPPAWMKTNDGLDNAYGGGTLRASDYRVYAAYLTRFLRAYAGAGIDIGALSLQNEPGIATLYPGLNLSAAQELTLLGDLQPALAAARLNPRLYAGDLGWGPTTGYLQALALARRAGAGGLTGLAWHCYYGQPSVMSQVHLIAPRLDSILDECSPGLTPTPIAEIVISSLRNWASLVDLWNLALDPTGGPVQAPNHGCAGCSALATIDPLTGAASLTLSYYQLGQASAFIAPGARRIATNDFVAYRYPHPGVNVASPGLDDVAVRNPGGGLALVAYDNSPAPITFAVSWRGRAFSYTLPAGATVTFSWN